MLRKGIELQCPLMPTTGACALLVCNNILFGINFDTSNHFFLISEMVQLLWCSLLLSHAAPLDILSYWFRHFSTSKRCSLPGLNSVVNIASYF